MGSNRWSSLPRRGLWIAGVALLLGWVVTLSVLILTAPAPGAASAPELAEHATAALNARDAEAFAELLAAPLDQEFAQAYLDRLQHAGARDIAVTLEHGDVVEIRGLAATGPFRIGLVAVSEDGRFLLSALPPI